MHVGLSEFTGQEWTMGLENWTNKIQHNHALTVSVFSVCYAKKTSTALLVFF